MKKIIILMFLSLSFGAKAELNDLHFYSKKDFFDKVALEVTIEKDPSMLAELADIGYSYDLAPIHIAVIEENKEALYEIIKYKEYIDVKNKYDQTALMLALKNGLVDISKILIDSGASLNLIDLEGNTVNAYADVGNIDLSNLTKKEEKVINTTEKVEESKDFSSKEFKVIEENINQIVEMINKNVKKIEEISFNKNDYKGVIEKTNQEVENIKEKLIKQSTILLPIVKNNLDKIKLIDEQMLTIDKKATEIKEKILEIDNLNKKLIEKVKKIDELKEKIVEKNVKSEDQENSLNSIKNDIQNFEKTTNNNNNKLNLLENDDEILKIEPISNIIEEENENVAFLIIKENLMLILLIILSLFVLSYIILKGKFKKKDSEINNIETIIEEEKEVKEDNYLKNIKFKENKKEEKIDDNVVEDELNEILDDDPTEDDFDSIMEDEFDEILDDKDTEVDDYKGDELDSIMEDELNEIFNKKDDK